MSVFRQQLVQVLDDYQWKIALVAVLLSAVLGFIIADHGIGLVLLIALGIGTAAFIALRPESATLVVIFALYANLPIVAIWSGVPNIVAGSFFLLLGIPLGNYVLVRKQEIIIVPAFILMVVYLSLILLSAANSSYPANTFPRIKDYVLEGIILFFLIINTLRTPELLRKTIWVLILAGGFVGSLSLYQGITQDYQNEFWGLAQASDATIGVSTEDFLGNQDRVVRLAGNVGEKNRYAQNMLLLLPLALSRFWAERSLRLRVLALVLCVPIMTGVLLSFSRGAGVAAVGVYAAMGLLRVVRLRTLILVGVGFFVAANVFVPGYFYRIQSLSDISQVGVDGAEGVDGSLKGRTTENLAALRVFFEHPILGVGPGQTKYYIRLVANEIGIRRIEVDRRAHIMYYEELADTGIVGFTGLMSIVLLIMFQLYRLMWRYKKVDSEIYYTAAGLLLAIISYLATAAFLHLSYVRYYFFLLAFAAAAVQVYQARASNNQEHPPRDAKQLTG